jgi:hypothetical protein|tara:strand:+ start:489 stop:938 length:450 start_codon:yes stop_codon:yes gene_type:complete
MAKDNKKFKDTKVGKWVAEKLPDVADTLGGVLPDQGVLGVVKRVVAGDPELSAEDKLEFERLAAEQEMNAQEQVTRRWEADAKSDVKLAKYIRPMTLIVLTVFFMVLTVWDGMDMSFMPPENYIDLLEVLMLAVFSAYFAGRTIEKVRK